MNVKNGLGANSITIASGATLGLQINGDNVLSNEALALSNGGEITLAAKAGLSAGEYAVSAAGITDYGATKPTAEPLQETYSRLAKPGRCLLMSRAKA